MSIPKSVLAFGAHPDDVEFMCAGALSLLKKKGWDVHMAVMAGGQGGGPVGVTREENSRVRLREYAASGAILDAPTYWAGGEDSELAYTHDLRVAATHILRQAQPSIVLTHSPVDYHPDHETTSRLARYACFLATAPAYAPCEHPALPNIPHLYYWDALEGTDYFGAPLPVGFYLDITSEIEIKADMLNAHESQRAWLREQHGMDNYIAFMRDWSAKRGHDIGVGFGEAFRQHLGHAYPKDNLLKKVLAKEYRDPPRAP